MDSLGTSELENYTTVSSLSFLIGSHISQTGLCRNHQHGTSKTHRQESSKKSLFLQAKGLRKGWPNNRKLVCNTCPTPAKHRQKNITSSSVVSSSWSFRKLIFYPSQVPWEQVILILLPGIQWCSKMQQGIHSSSNRDRSCSLSLSRAVLAACRFHPTHQQEDLSRHCEAVLVNTRIHTPFPYPHSLVTSGTRWELSILLTWY